MVLLSTAALNSPQSTHHAQSPICNSSNANTGGSAYLFILKKELTTPSTTAKNGTRCFGFAIRPVYDDVEKYYRNGITQANWDAATSPWGHGGRGHANAQNLRQIQRN